MEKKKHEHTASLEAMEETERPGPLIYGLETESSFFWKVGDSRPHFGSDSIKNMSSCKSCQKKWVSAARETPHSFSSGQETWVYCVQ